MRCPVCKAGNTTGSSCRRCRADLSLLFTLDEQRQALLAKAQQALQLRQPEQAEALAVQALRLRADGTVYQILAVSQLLQRNYAAAWRSYLAPRSQGGEHPRVSGRWQV